MLAGGSLFDIQTFVGMIVGSSLCAMSAAVFNQSKEIVFDSKMQRTRNRPLPTGRISPSQAQQCGWLSGVAGVGKPQAV